MTSKSCERKIQGTFIDIEMSSREWDWWVVMNGC
jgi:hypothetical protein